MNKYLKSMLPLALVSLVLASSSCSESKTNTKEESEISKMDSISKAVKISTEKLEEQTKKVEESLEKLDKEFEANK